MRFTASQIFFYFFPPERKFQILVLLLLVYISSGAHVMSRKKNILLLMNKRIKATHKIQKKKHFEYLFLFKTAAATDYNLGTQHAYLHYSTF